MYYVCILYSGKLSRGKIFVVFMDQSQCHEKLHNIYAVWYRVAILQKFTLGSSQKNLPLEDFLPHDVYQL